MLTVAAHTQNAIGRWGTYDFAAIGAENAGTTSQPVGAACLCGLL